MFDASKSKLFGPIMEALRGFFSLSESATESDIHNALDGQKPLSEQLSDANNETKFFEISERFTALETSFSEMKTAGEAKDTLISEMQAEMESLKLAADDSIKAFETKKVEYENQIKVLAGQNATLKAGKSQEQDQGGDDHEAGKKRVNDQEVIALVDGPLKKMLQTSAN